MEINWPEVVIGALIGTALGTVPGFIFGKREGERSAAGTRRFEASEAINAVVGKFREQLEKDHQVASQPAAEDGSYVVPATYGNRGAQASLAAVLYYETRYLGKCKRRSINRRLNTLVGKNIMDKTKKNLHSAAREDPDANALMNAALRDMYLRMKEGSAWKVGDGLLTQMAQFTDNWERDYAKPQNLLEKIEKSTEP